MKTGPISPATKAKILLAYLHGGGCRGGAANRNTNAAYMGTFADACVRFIATKRPRHPTAPLDVRVHAWRDTTGVHLAVAAEIHSSYIVAWAAHPTDHAQVAASIERTLKLWYIGNRYRSSTAALPPMVGKTKGNRLPLAVALAAVHRNFCSIDALGTTPAMRLGVAKGPFSEEGLVLAVLGLADKVAIVPEGSVGARAKPKGTDVVNVFGRDMSIGELALLAETTPERIRLGMYLGKSAAEAAFQRMTFVDITS